MTCPICRHSNEKCSKHYAKCESCGTIYTTEIINPTTENDNPGIRNSLDNNSLRWTRIKTSDVVLDFGCGDGSFVEFLRQHTRTIGIDTHTEMQLEHLSDETIGTITMIEVIEHLEDPRDIFRQFYRVLKPNGLLYIETTFADRIKEIDKHPYANPNIGHRTIVSKQALADMAVYTGFTPPTYLNPHVAILRKVT